jgi:hypothetical protein
MPHPPLTMEQEWCFCGILLFRELYSYLFLLACHNLTRTRLAIIIWVLVGLSHCSDIVHHPSSQFLIVYITKNKTVSEGIKKGREELARNWKRNVIRRKKRFEAFHPLTHTECKLYCMKEVRWYWLNWWSRGNALDLHLGDTQFESWLGHWRSWLRFFMVFLNPSRQMPWYYHV